MPFSSEALSYSSTTFSSEALSYSSTTLKPLARPRNVVDKLLRSADRMFRAIDKYVPPLI